MVDLSFFFRLAGDFIFRQNLERKQKGRSCLSRSEVKKPSDNSFDHLELVPPPCFFGKVCHRGSSQNLLLSYESIDTSDVLSYLRTKLFQSTKVPSYDMILSYGSTKVRKYLRTKVRKYLRRYYYCTLFYFRILSSYTCFRKYYFRTVLYT